MSKWIVVLADGETWMELEGTKIFEIKDIEGNLSDMEKMREFKLRAVRNARDVLAFPIANFVACHHKFSPNFCGYCGASK